MPFIAHTDTHLIYFVYVQTCLIVVVVIVVFVRCCCC